MNSYGLTLLLVLALAPEHGLGAVYMGKLRRFFHGVQGEVYATGCNEWRIDSFYYDGLGPDVFFYYGTTPSPSGSGAITRFRNAENGTATGSPLTKFAFRRRYSNAQVFVEVPASTDVSRVKWLSVWCRAFRADFGSIVFTSDALSRAAKLCVQPTTTVSTQLTIMETQSGTLTTETIPATTTTTLTTAKSSANPMTTKTESQISPTPPPVPTSPTMCTDLADNYSMCWSKNIENESLSFTLCNANLGVGEYMAFGWSKNSRRSIMKGSDAVVCAFKDDYSWSVDDYFLHSKKQCKEKKKKKKTKGVCKDISFGGTDQLSGKAGGVLDGIAWCSFTRSIEATEKYDRDIIVSAPQAIVWSAGPVGREGIGKHTSHTGTRGRGQTIDFSDADVCTNGNMISCCMETL